MSVDFVSLLLMFAGVILGVIGSIYAGIATTRLIYFFDLRAELCEAIIMITGSSNNNSISPDIHDRLEHFSRIAWRFLAQGHICAMEGVKSIQSSLLEELSNQISTKLNVEPKSQQIRFHQVNALRPSWWAILIPLFPPPIRLSNINAK